MNELTFECPVCSADIPVTAEALCGAPLICPECHAVFYVEISLVCEGE